MPADPRRRSEALQWLFAALNSVEMASLPWSIVAFSGDTGETPGWKRLDEFLKARLRHMEPVLAGRAWLAGSFSVADILMADVLRLVDRFDGLEQPACRDYVVRATARPFVREGPRRPDGAFCRGKFNGAKVIRFASRRESSAPRQRGPARSTGPSRFIGVPGRTASRATARATGRGRSTTPGLTTQPAG